jgi:hypothetical protein
MARMLMNILGPNARAPLHIGDSSIGQYPSGSWIAEFLIALPLGTLFIEIMAWCLGLKKKINLSDVQIRDPNKLVLLFSVYCICDFIISEAFNYYDHNKMEL